MCVFPSCVPNAEFASAGLALTEAMLPSPPLTTREAPPLHSLGTTVNPLPAPRQGRVANMSQDEWVNRSKCAPETSVLRPIDRNSILFIFRISSYLSSYREKHGRFLQSPHLTLLCEVGMRTSHLTIGKARRRCRWNTLPDKTNSAVADCGKRLPHG